MSQLESTSEICKNVYTKIKSYIQKENTRKYPPLQIQAKLNADLDILPHPKLKHESQIVLCFLGLKSSFIYSMT